MKKLLPSIIVLLFAGFFQIAKAQNISNEGSDFWLPFPTHDPSGNSLANMNVFVTSKANSEVTVSCGAYTETKPILANTIVTFSVPRANSYINASEGNAVLTNKGIHVVTTAGKPNVAVYAHIYAGARSAASLILPRESLGQKYYSMNYTQDGGGGNFLVLVATEDKTDLVIHEVNGTTRNVSLPKAGDVYEYLPGGGADLTGTFVEVNPLTSQCKRFAAFSGSTSLTIACTGSRDPLFQQLYTTNSWGKNYGAIPFIGRRYILRVLAQEDNTNINVNGLVQKINKGQFYETQQLTEAVLVSADKLISVAQYSLTQACSSIAGNMIIGDPEMVLLNPTEFNIKNITVFSSSNQAIQTKYVNIFMKTAKTSTFKLNGNLPDNGIWQPVPGDANYSYIQIQVFEESLTLTADDGFNAIAYGFGNAESYAYSAGTSLASTQFLLLLNKTTGEENASACIGQPADFKLTLPYQLLKLVWKFSDGTPDYIDNAPIGVQSTVNGQTLYTYTAPVNKAFAVVGRTQISATATIPPNGGTCFPTSEIELIFNFDVDPLPKAVFTKVTSGCADKEIAFKDVSSSQVTGKIITKWLWDFGDGKTSTEQNPKHTYAASGNFTVTLSVGAENGCLSDVATEDILINPKVTSLFVVNQNSCIDTDISFINQSTIAAPGTIVKWTWDMGDGKAPIQGDGTPFNYKYAAPGKYTVTLVAESDKGCISKPFSLDVNITTLPIADFIIPDVCLADAQAVFVNSSTDYDGTIPTGLTYLWNFGDVASGALNTSTERDGKHKYNAPGNYTVTLIITNVNGCAKTLSLPFTVNGSFPKADFETLNANNLCSNQLFTLKNISTVDFGNITKVQWYIDGVKYGDDDLDPTVGKLYDFIYPQFTAPLTKTLKVRMVVYSGGTCSNEIIHDVILLASPVVKFDALEAVCLNGGVVQFTGAETGGLLGSYEYTGKGVSTTGLFNPIIAGIGVHDITYTFTASNGCTNAQTQTIEVYPVPTVDAGADFYLLAGGQKQISATARGNGLSYKWTPSIGLSADDVLSPIANPEQDTKYTLTVTSSQGCYMTDDVYVYVLQSVNAPNSFTPNGDGVNDVWNVKYLDTYPNANVEIYNRNGERVYFSKGYAVPFDGNYNNKPLPIGTYYYIINPNSGRKSITGNLTIIR
ncbi:PKD domain-containing protein [Pedobacter frigiditerrae]|uniref:PKD domain-containing protein n=1 Tax=Pedobacter frigiditerrae TaxID=2530452 RepID=A0A4R0MQK8_9SPHI|nr:PKD domain-containing protein [Pedobacter frigiditerrae]TCC89148.1 PKD domain-containing protein [Pedobacter frigiditerrae]